MILPRPGTAVQSPIQSIAAPPESEFIECFGPQLPAARFLSTVYGKAAYYELSATTSTTNADTETTADGKPERVVFIHGVQTPALGMMPLVRCLRTAFPHAHFVLLDLWGHGLSDTPIVPHEAKLFHAQIDALLDELRWKSAHFVAFSFGAATTVSYIAAGSGRVESVAFVAPAGLLRSSDLTEQQRAYMRGGEELEEAAREWILDFLEGGALVVPRDWRRRVEQGEIIAEAVREWQMVHHPGHTASVIAMFRDGGVYDTHAEFVKVADNGVKSVVVLGELDGVCSKQDINKVGFENVAVVPQAGHAVVRDRAAEVSREISRFWMTL